MLTLAKELEGPLPKTERDAHQENISGVFGFHSFYNQHKKADSEAIGKANNSLVMVQVF